MKYEINLIIRVLMALLIRPDFFYFTLIYLTMIFPYIFLNLLNYDVRFLYESKSLFVNNINLEFVKACVATSAYYLLALLILTTKDIGLKNSIKMFLIGSLLIFIMNILRITLLIIMVLNLGLDWFNAIHLTFWYIVSSLYVFLVWIFLIRLYKVKNIPVFSDLVYLTKIIARKKK